MSPQTPEVYCYAPWVHSFINTRGKRNHCCFREKGESSVDESERVSLGEYWNSEEVRADRLLMLNNQVPKGCYPCHDKVFYRSHPRHFFFDKYPNLDRMIRENTDETGRTDLLPRFVDYRFSNFCNFACRMCAPGSSSKIEALEKKVASAYKEIPSQSLDSQVRPFLNQTVLPELLQMVQEGQVDQFYWAGGEPLLTPEHWKVMKLALDQGQAPKIDVVYNTNLSLLSFKGNSWLDLIRPFKSVNVLASLDATGEVGEYIRSGLKWEVFQQNIRTLKALPRVGVNLTVTLTVPGILYLKDLLDYIQKEGLDYDVHLASANGMHELLSPFILPQKLRERIVQQALDLCSSYQDPRFDQMIKVLEQILRQPEIPELNYPGAEADFFKHRDIYQLKEKGSPIKLESLYRRRNKELADWWSRPRPKKLAGGVKLSTIEKIELQWAEELMRKARNKKVAFLFARPKAWHKIFQEKFPDVHFLNIQDVLNSNEAFKIYSSFLIVNELRTSEEFQLLKKCTDGQELRLVGPSQSFLNRVMNRKFKEKRRLARVLTPYRLADIDPFFYMVAQRTERPFFLRFGGFLGLCLFWMRGMTSLHSYYRIMRNERKRSL